ncbi:hypothetical protein BUE80_DR009507 [Diplocarpon rosae]|nr:hypothetical protein BUE80_DR009507 [Diplocarpon rosae]
MPIHRGIAISIVSQVELKTHPEFPHPESSQFTYRSPDLRRGPPKAFDWTPPSASSDSKADRLLGRQSVVSVYIPSLPATRFWIRYNIVEAAITHSEWFYFKLFMNGRHITSWGTNARTRPSGQVMRGLFEPSDRWNYKHEGIVFKNMGTEARLFIFGHEDEKRSAASDGGLIEVMVFRARGRKRRLPKPTDFKNQEGYGLIMPSGGLLEKPQDAKFYDWHLKDPKDSPFATFKFHYRSWDSLTNLQLIPENHPRTLISSPSDYFLKTVTPDLQTKLEEDLDNENMKEELKRSLSPTVVSDPWLTSVFDDSPERPADHRDKKRSAFIVPSIRGSPEPPTSKFSIAIIDKPTSPKESPPWLGRPLPEVPNRDSSSTSLRRHPRKYSVASVGHSRNSSGMSHAPSIAPSLLQELDRDSLSPEPPILGIAELVDVYSPKPYHPSPSLSLSEFPPVPSASPFTGSPIPLVSSTSSKRRGIAPPPINTLFSMKNVTVRKSRRSPEKSFSKSSTHVQKQTLAPDSPCPAPSCPRTQTFSTLSLFSGDASPDAEQSSLSGETTSLSLSESEWMCRTPSPVKTLPRFSSLQRMWSPGLENRKSGDISHSCKENANQKENSRMATGAGRVDANSRALKRRDMDGYEKFRASNSDTSPVLPGSESEGYGGRMSGNWI